MQRFPVYFLLAVLMGIIGFQSCSTKKNTLITRSYHNLTSHYNIYFNGIQSMKEGEERIKNNYEENYSRILPVFIASEFEQTGTITSDMERTIEKSTKVIELHSITSRPKRGGLFKKDADWYRREEYNKWIDECYVLIGKSHYYLKRYIQAMEAFKYIIENFEYQEKRYDAMVWLFRTYVENGNLKEAAVIANQIEKERDFPERLQAQYNAVYAYFYLEQEMHAEAVPRLKKAIEESRDKEDRVRYTYILAQVQEELNNYHEASVNYGKVVKHNPPYEMSFNAKINQASLMDVNRGNTGEVKKELQKMLKDDKNIEYRDQIYYALAKLEHKEGNVTKAIEYYEKSSGSSMDNNNQKVLTYLSLADIYFNRQVYDKAGAYYDSTVTFIDEDFPDYEEILTNTRNLNELVENLNIITLEDSVQKLAQLPESQQKQVVNQIISDYMEAEKKRKEAEAGRTNFMYQENRAYRDNLSQSGKWYFYNPSSLSYGQTEFEKKWGKRKLEDNWRRKDKQSAGFQSEMTMEEESGTEEDSAVVLQQYSKTDPNYYLQNIPNTPEKLEASNKRLAEAYYNAGKIYQDELDDPDKAIESYETLVTRFPENINALPGLYELYMLHREQDNMAEANRYKDRIVSEYPNTNYARLLTNPDFLKELEEQEQQLENFYSHTYTHYKEGNYTKVNENFQLAKEEYKTSYLYPKFAFLNALSQGQQANNRIFKNLLTEYKTQYSGHELSERADVIIKKIEEMEVAMAMEPAEPDSGTREGSSAEQADEVIYTFTPEKPHYFVIVVQKDVDMNQLRFNFISFIVDYYNDLDKFDIEEEPLTEDFMNLTIKEFKNLKNANLFYKRLLNDKQEVLKQFNEGEYQFFLISAANYTNYMKDKSVRYYLQFFQENYQLNE